MLEKQKNEQIANIEESSNPNTSNTTNTHTTVNINTNSTIDSTIKSIEFFLFHSVSEAGSIDSDILNQLKIVVLFISDGLQKDYEIFENKILFYNNEKNEQNKKLDR